MNSYPRPKSTNHLTKLFTIVIIALTLFAVPAMSQNTNPWPASGNVGIGTTGPLAPLHVFISNGSNYVSKFQTGTASNFVQLLSTSGSAEYGIYNDSLYFQPLATLSNGLAFYKGDGTVGIQMLQSGFLGIGTTTPQGVLQVYDPFYGDAFIVGDSPLSAVNGTKGFRILPNANGNIYLDFKTGASGAIIFRTGQGTETGYQRTWMAVDATTGNVGIGTASPAATLDVNGNINVSGNIAAKYQDVAEWVPATKTMEPGTVVVLNPEKSNEVMPATRAYDTTVAGVVSANPGVILGEGSASKAQIATSGRVRVKASATEQPIHIGDLLVTSGETGVAMKSVPMQIGGRAFHQPGTIIGKALEPLDRGEREILVLLSLQ